MMSDICGYDFKKFESLYSKIVKGGNETVYPIIEGTNDDTVALCAMGVYLYAERWMRTAFQEEEVRESVRQSVIEAIERPKGE
jgi:hypothetical protein